jgi:poly(A) polymerase Pap1
MVESKLRVLVMKLEILPGIESAPPFPYGFESSLTGSNLEAASSSNQNQPEGSLLDELSDSKKFYCTSYYIGLEVKMKSNGI